MRPRWYTPQNISLPDAQAQYQILNSVVLIALLGVLGAIAALFIFESTSTSRIAMISLAVLLLASFVLLRMRILLPAQIMVPVSLFAGITFNIAFGSGLHDVAMSAYGGVLVIASLTLGKRGMYIFTALIILTFFGLWWVESTGRLTTDASALTTPDDPFLVSIIIFAIALTMSILQNRYTTSLRLARENEQAQIKANSELIQLKNSLEERVETRTGELTRRASQLEAIARVSRAISTVQDLEILLPSITRVISEQFDFYHTGIFLLDERSEYAALVAANSAGGQRMLQRGHRLQVGATGLVGHATAYGEPRIALDVGADAVYFNNPDLPDTRSEIALPLMVGADVIGALDVQSTETNAFQTEDIRVLSTLANQVAIAINNSRLFSQTRKALAESQEIYEQYIKSEWARFHRSTGPLGFTYDGLRTYAAPPAAEKGTGGTRIPIKIRGAAIGEITIRANDPLRHWTPDELGMAQAAAERAGLAIENARLLNEAQRRAAKERTIGDISSRLSASIDMNDIMRTAVEELGRSLSGAEVVLQLRPGEDGKKPAAREAVK
ncbi:MAG: hypothetical protein HFACDABA_01132 [Anaerolineales bacterium]|nr:hypothetical protein [Anaerolineales bacterium]